MQGKTIYGYTLQKRLGVGGMAEVWLAENEIGKLAAVKLLLPKFCHDEDIVTRFKNEAKVMVKLDHPNIRQVYDYGEIDGRPGIVMEYLEGDDLKALLKSGKRFSNEELRRWWNQIADALNYTHAQGIVHRDIKPSNIFLDKKGNMKLLDFGIAKIKEGISMTQTGAMMGTLIYMSPEQVDDAKHLGPASDVYSLAVSFVHLLTGKAPYDTNSLSDFKIREGIVYKPLDMTGVPAEWQAFLKPYLEKEPEKRPALRAFETVSPSASEPVADDDDSTFADFSHEDATSIKNNPSIIEKKVKSPKTKRKRNLLSILIPVIAILLFGVIAIGIMYYNKDSKHDITVYINDQNLYLLENTLTDESHLIDVIKTQIGNDIQAKVVLRSDKSVPIQYIVSVYNAVRQINYTTGNNHQLILANGDWEWEVIFPSSVSKTLDKCLITVSINNQYQYFVEGIPVAKNRLMEEIDAQISSCGQGTVVLKFPHKNVPVQFIFNVIDAINKINNAKGSINKVVLSNASVALMQENIELHSCKAIEGR